MIFSLGFLEFPQSAWARAGGEGNECGVVVPVGDQTWPSESVGAATILASKEVDPTLSALHSTFQERTLI